MPHYFNNILVVKESEIVPKFWNNYNSLAKAIKRSEDREYGIKKVQSGGNGRELLVLFDSLPQEYQSQLDDPRRSQHVLERFYWTDEQAVQFFQSTGYIDDAHLEKNVTNASVLQALIRLKEAREREIIGKGYKPKKIFQTLCDDAISFNPVLLAKWKVQHTLPENYRILEQKFKKFVEFGYQSLIHKGIGLKNALKVTDETLELLANLFADDKTKPSFARVKAQYSAFLDGYIEVINNKTGEIYSPKGFKQLSKATIYNYLNAWESKVGTYTKRSGDRQVLMGQMKPAHSLAKPKFAGSIVSVDDRQPPFEYAPQKRMWFYLAQDIASGAIITWVYGKTKEGIIVEFYREMVRKHAEWGFALPAELECESSLNSTFKETILKEGNMFQYVRIEANNARGKYIESGFNRQIRYDIEKNAPGWIARPKAKDEANQASSANVPMIPYDQLVNARLKDIETWNNTEHPEWKGHSRWEFYCEKRNENLKPINWRGILPFIGYKTETSCNAGIIALNNSEFLLGENGSISFGDELIDKMKEVEGLGANSIDIYWLDDSNGDVLKALVYIGNRYICEAVAKPRYNKARIEQTEKDIEARELMSKYVASIESFQRQQTRKLQPVTIIETAPRTINNNFKITERRVFEYDENETVEVLEELFNDELNSVEPTFKTSLANRF